MTVVSRYVTKVPVPIHEYHQPESRGLVLDIGDRGLRVAGIRAQVDEIKTLVIPADELVMIDPLVFEASCRWVKQDESGGVTAGFAVTRVSKGNFQELKLLIKSMVPDPEPPGELRPLDLDTVMTQSVDLSSLFS
ncbi:MAG: hypothetical protein FJY85_09365, partial [Deltaproteobacteria bacterium]|nr:hypothetical protein [Deltaproteobacteria bacterium]